MQSKHLIILLLSTGIAVNTNAKPPTNPPAEPLDVNVVNTPNVTVTNPQTTVTVDNTTPIPVDVQNQSSGCTESQFVGFTTATFNGGQGVVTYTNACQQDYPGSWMCSSKEFLESKAYPSVTGDGWIKPTFVPPVSLALGNGTTVVPNYFIVQDMSGYISSANSPRGLSCGGWGEASGIDFGLVVDALGKFVRHFCNTTHSVACCSSAP